MKKGQVHLQKDKLDFFHRSIASKTPDGGFSRENTFLNKKESQLALWPGVAAWFDSYWEDRHFPGNAPHHDLVFTFIVSGKMIYEHKDGSQTVLQAGDFQIPRFAGNPRSNDHILHVKKEEPLFRLGLILKRNVVMNALLPQLNSSGQSIHCSNPEAVEKLFLAMKEEICSENGSNMVLGSLLLKLMEEILRQKESCVMPLPLQKAVDCVAREGCLLSLERLVEVSGVSKRTLQTLFQKYFRCSPVKYLANTRMEYAKTLLHSHSLMISEIASLCGFSSAESFSRFFKAHTGKSPRHFM